MDEKINVARDAVVKVFCVHSEPDYSQPWQQKQAYATTSSGFIISGRKVLTNAHCVKYYTQVRLMKRGSDVKYLAKVLAIGNECDLALLTVEDDEFWGDVSPVEFGSLPGLQDAVSVVGGDTTSITSGVVMHFIKDYEKNGKYTGFPSLGFTWKTMKHHDYRMARGMSPEQTGVLVKEIMPTSPAFHVLKPCDIILSFDGMDIANDGTVLFKHGEHIGFSDLVSQKYTGDVAIVKLIRDSKIIELRIKLAARVPLVPVYMEAPSYFIVAGIVFTVVSVPYMDSAQDSMEEEIYVTLKEKCLRGMPQFEDGQLVVISQVLEADINFGCEGITNLQVLAFNGNPVRNLKSLAMMVEKCDDEYLKFKLDCDESVVLRTKTAKEATEDILSTYAIPSAMSSDLKT